MKMKLLLISMLAAATPVQAEYFELHSEKGWSVGYDSGSSELEEYCLARTAGEFGLMEIGVNGAGEIYTVILDKDHSWGDQQGSIIIEIDTMGPWRAKVQANDNVLFIGGVSARYLAEIALGKIIRFDFDSDGEWDSAFSLTGSSSAIMALGECREKLGGTLS